MSFSLIMGRVEATLRLGEALDFETIDQDLARGWALVEERHGFVGESVEREEGAVAFLKGRDARPHGGRDQLDDLDMAFAAWVQIFEHVSRQRRARATPQP